MQRAPGSQHLQHLPIISSSSPVEATQQMPATHSVLQAADASGSLASPSPVHRQSPTANLAAALARAAHNSPALAANHDRTGAATAGDSSREVGIAARALPAEQGRAETGLQRFAQSEHQPKAQLEFSRHASTHDTNSSSSSASFDSWRVDRENQTGTATASRSPAHALRSSSIGNYPTGGTSERHSGQAVLPQASRQAGAEEQSREGWTDWLVSQVQQSGLMPGRQSRQFVNPYKALQSPSNRNRQRPAPDAGTHIQTPMSEQGSSGPSPLELRQQHAGSPAGPAGSMSSDNFKARSTAGPAGSRSTSRFKAAAADLSPMASALAGIRCGHTCMPRKQFEMEL